ncbi:MAG: hypothetical protein Q8L47_00210 [bacterium]|nr:hypothetical protein [bacterium]
MEREKFRLISGGKDKPLREVNGLASTTIEKSRIDESEVFSMGEVVGLIEQIAKQEGFKRDDLEITQEAYNTNNQLIVLRVMVNLKKSIAVGWGSIEYT